MLKEYRERNKLTQEQLAIKAGIDYTNYQRIETNTTVPQTNTFAKIVLALKLSNEEIKNLLIYYSKIDTKKGKTSTK